MEHAAATARTWRRRRRSFLLAPFPGPFMHFTLHFRRKYAAAVDFMPPSLLEFT